MASHLARLWIPPSITPPALDGNSGREPSKNSVTNCTMEPGQDANVHKETKV